MDKFSLIMASPLEIHFVFSITKMDFKKLLDVIANVQIKAEKAPIVILESTGHYHQAAIQYLEEHGILFLVVNPLISHQAKKSSLRKVQTNAVDAFRLYVVLIDTSEVFIELRVLMANRETIVHRLVSVKNHIHRWGRHCVPRAAAGI